MLFIRNRVTNKEAMCGGRWIVLESEVAVACRFSRLVEEGATYREFFRLFTRAGFTPYKYSRYKKYD
jgi:hypothetical protein